MAAAGLVALQREVGGDARSLAELYDSVWGLEAGTIGEIERYVMGPQGDMLRYVLGEERSLARVNMPLQSAGTISVSMSNQVRSDYGLERSIDWTRIRVMAEARFYMTVRTEGQSMIELGRGPPPGDLAADVRRRGVLVFQPYIASGFSYPTTSLVMRIPEGATTKRLQVSPKLYERVVVMARGDVSKVMNYVVKPRPKYTESRVVTSVAVSTDVIRSATAKTISKVLVSAVRGKTVARALRSQVYNTVVETLSQYSEGMETVAEMLRAGMEFKDELKTRRVQLVSAMAKACGSLSLRLRSALSTELGRKRLDITETWHDYAQVLPPEIRPDRECSLGWVLWLCWEILTDNDAKWRNLVLSVGCSRINILMSVQNSSILPRDDTGKFEYCRVFANNYVLRFRQTWGKYYLSTASVAYLVECAIGPNAQNTVLYKMVLLGKLLWEFRGRAFCSASVKAYTAARFAEIQEGIIDAYTSKVTLDGAEYVFVFKYDIARAWAALKGSLVKFRSSYVVSRVDKDEIPHGWCENPTLPMGDASLVKNARMTRISRYVVSPALLWKNLADGLKDLAADCMNRMIAGFFYELPGLTNAPPAVGMPIVPVPIMPTIDTGNAWDLLCQVESGVDLYEAMSAVVGDDAANEVMLGTYGSAEELITCCTRLMKEYEAASAAAAGRGAGVANDAIW